VADAYYGEPDVWSVARGRRSGTASAGGSSGGTGADGSGDDNWYDSACPVAPEMISDFESGQGDMIRKNPRRSGCGLYYPARPGRWPRVKRRPAFTPAAQSLLRQRRMKPVQQVRAALTGQVSRPERDRGSTACPTTGRVRRRLLAPAPREPGFQTYDVSAYTASGLR